MEVERPGPKLKDKVLCFSFEKKKKTTTTTTTKTCEDEHVRSIFEEKINQ